MKSKKHHHNSKLYDNGSTQERTALHLQNEETTNEEAVSDNRKDPGMQTALRLKKTVCSKSVTLELPEFEQLLGKEIEIIVLVDGTIDDGSEPPKGIQNSPHVAGSYILDEEALQQLLDNRFK